MEIRRTDLSEPEVAALIDLHTREMFEGSPPGTNHALDLSGLTTPDMEAYAAWDGARLLAIGAIRKHDGFAEIKSMRAHPEARGTGAGKAILTALIERARELDYPEIKLETGSGELFEPATRLYCSFGFEPCGSFAGYTPGEFNKLFSLKI
ncbi:GNAT family N-acetyltransferase [Erythrobacter sp. KY5]|uniref:GNAT family N-acetyltransferase n=1 Tax=Erythrobacter sp. KY5 TaxID=2011159 RepID=UPI000DBF217E|nr:GNAT family N-acetyltransferase [Erythrobacter sp. KY5]AWW74874.1 GNAT family N-acetyltransferase [Erythrobacter sp. KY5]